MYYIKNPRGILLCVLLINISIFSIAENSNVNCLNNTWQFQLSDEAKSYEEILNSSEWRGVQIPHDWSIELPFDSINGEGCTGYLPGGIGWYQNDFNIDRKSNDKYYIYFDGVYNHSTHWINGQKLGYHIYGYSPFYFDITPYIKDGTNKLTVKVDRSRIADSRWYPGSGIYREAMLLTKPKLQIPIWGLFITTPNVSTETATVNLAIDILNEFDNLQIFDLKVKIYDANKKLVGTDEIEDISQKTKQAKYNLNVKIQKPLLWGIENPKLYTAEVSINQNGNTVSESSDRFGIRSINFDAEKGFFLNGKNVKIKGVCLHHDGGLVGAAVPKGVWKRRLNTLRDAGCNAIRSAHNPASEEFLDLCDEMGFLVQDEFFDEWDYPKDKRVNCWERHDDYISRGYADYFQENAEKDLKNSLLAHRNHPCIIQWSLGNEIEWTYDKDRVATGYFDTTNNFNDNFFWDMPPYSTKEIKTEYFRLPAQEYSIEKTAHKLAAWTRELDTTRPVTANCILPSVSLENGFSDALDVVGFSYRRILYDYAREKYPNVIVMGTENLPQWHEWKAIEERPFISGTFLWTGIDHMGEVNGRWPKKTSDVGLIDLAGFPKTPYHMYKTLWKDEPHIYVCSQNAEKSRYTVDSTGAVVEKEPGSWEKLVWFWSELNEHWNYTPNEQVIVEVYSNCEQVELFMNNKPLGVKSLYEFPDRVYRWSIPFEEGELRAEGICANERISYKLQTAKKPTAIQVKIDRTNLIANGKDVAHIECQLYDNAGNKVQHIESKLYFEITGKLKNLGVDNGNPYSTQKYQANEIITSNGRALIIVQAMNEQDQATLKIWGNDIEPSEYFFELSTE